MDVNFSPDETLYNWPFYHLVFLMGKLMVVSERASEFISRVAMVEILAPVLEV